MVPPKKDAFSDLFSHASGNSSKRSLNSSMKNLSVGNNSSTATEWNLDLLSPSVSGGQNQSNSSALSNSGQNGVEQNSNALDDDLLAFFETPQKKVETGQAGNLNVSSPKKKDVGLSSQGVSLLDDEFTDAFAEQFDTRESQKHQEHNQSFQDQLDDFDDQPTDTPSTDSDAVLAALVSEGFSVEISNNAIARVGPDFEKCVQLIIRGALAKPGQSTQWAKPSPTQKDLGITFQDMSNGIYKKASWLFDKSKKTVIKNINNIQQQINAHDTGNDSGMPAWIKSQALYKDQAVERKAGGGAYEDYGDDEENIDHKEIQRIIRAQREREQQRRQERQNALKADSNLERRSSERNSFERKSAWKEETQSGPKNHVASSVSSRNSSPQAFQQAKPQNHELKQQSDQTKQQSHQTKSQSHEKVPEVDLLGLGTDDKLSPAQKFKASSTEEIPVSRRRRPAPASSSTATQSSTSSLTQLTSNTKTFKRLATAEPLNAFQQSDYDTFKAKGSEFFSNGDYDSALNAYTKCLESLPGTHELRIVILSNVALTAIKLGNYKLAKQSCDDGINLIDESAEDTEWNINQKPIKYWFLRLLTRKAESFEMLENFPQALELYLLLVSKYGVNDKKIMDAKRRVNNVVNPPKPVAKSIAKPAPQSKPNANSNKNLERVKTQHSQEKLKEEEKFQLHDIVYDKVKQWSSGKEDNLRNLLMTLSDVLPQRLGFPFITTKKITINDLMLTKKVKINYMKVISSIHPDKLGQYELEDQMICQATFVTLNKAWDTFKEQNNIS